MNSPPWLTIVGIGEDGMDGLSAASRAALAAADLVMGKATGVPVAIVRGVDPAAFTPDPGRAGVVSEIVRSPADDLFR